MASDTSDIIKAPERRTAYVVHYTLSYLLQGAEHGTDGAIVLLHDIPAGAFTWENIMPQLAGLRRAVYAIDMLGYGLSDHPWPADTSIWGQADDISFLFKQLNLTNVILVGHGIGGGVAQVLATRLVRERLAALVLVDTICYLHAFAQNWPLPDMEKLQDYDAPKHLSVEDMIHNLRETLPHAVHTTDAFAKVIDYYVNPWNSELGKEVLLQHVRLLIPNYINSVASDLHVLGKPVLIIWGAEDEITPPKYAQRLHREIPASSQVIVPDAGHMILFDAPDAVAHALLDFIKGL
jgi:pimeloyl-ACP methyl ester carboxylesterase